RINITLKNYLTPQVLKIQHHQMNECLLYHVEKIMNWKFLIGRENQITKNQVHYEPIEVANDIEFAENSYESVITNLDLLIKYIDRFTIQEVWHVMTIEQNKEHFVYKVTMLDPQGETAITIANSAYTSNLETVKQNLTRQEKYNQGFGYAKKAVELAFKTGYKNELNKLLQDWIEKTERKIHYNLNKLNKKNLPNISNSYLTHTKGISKKYIKSAFENSISKYQGKSGTYTATKNLQDLNYRNNNDKQFEEANQQNDHEKKSSKYVCSYCK
ncbi:9511_t:CDS:2, partial [Racocetra persica]